jgi:hypothetical protein
MKNEAVNRYRRGGVMEEFRQDGNPWAGRQREDSPWKRGQIFLQAVTLPWLVYWPNATSRKNTGMPQLKKKMK